MSAVIYQPTDLAGSKRREFLDAAKAGRARLRDSDGTSIVALAESELDALDLVATWSWERERLVTLLAGADRPLTAVELGNLAWLHVLERGDQLAFAAELHEALVLAMSRRDGVPVRETVHAWQVTTAELEDPERRAVLLGGSDQRDFVDAGHDLPDTETTS